MAACGGARRGTGGNMGAYDEAADMDCRKLHVREAMVQGDAKPVVLFAEASGNGLHVRAWWECAVRLLEGTGAPLYVSASGNLGARHKVDLAPGGDRRLLRMGRRMRLLLVLDGADGVTGL